MATYVSPAIEQIADYTDTTQGLGSGFLYDAYAVAVTCTSATYQKPL